MAREFRLPDIGEGLTEAEIVRWLVQVGDSVTEDQTVVEVETDKAVVEIPIPYEGTVESLGGAEGDVIAVGSVLITIGDGATSADTRPSPTESRSPFEDLPQRPMREMSGNSEPIVGTLDEDPETLGTGGQTPKPGAAAVKALPIVRKLARENDIDLTTVDGSGPGGRILREDVEAVIRRDRERAKGTGTPEPAFRPTPATTTAFQPASSESEQSAPTWRPEPSPPATQPDPSTASTTQTDLPARQTASASPEPTDASDQRSEGGDERRTMSRLRRTIARNMSRSWSEIPHVTTFDDVDATRLLEVRAALGQRHGVKVPLEALIIKAVIPALTEYPEFNASIDGDHLVVHGSYDIGIAVDTAEGLMVAVVHDADERSVRELTDDVRRLGEGARERTLTTEELSGQTFTVSNIGAVGGGHGTPIVPYGTTAILSVGQAKMKPIVFEGDLAIAPVMPLSLSYDHRVIDGAVGRRFIQLVIENLEEPALFLAG